MQSAQCNDDMRVVVTWTLQWNRTLLRIRLKGKMLLKLKLMQYGVGL